MFLHLTISGTVFCDQRIFPGSTSSRSVSLLSTSPPSPAWAWSLPGRPPSKQHKLSQSTTPFRRSSCVNKISPMMSWGERIAFLWYFCLNRRVFSWSALLLSSSPPSHGPSSPPCSRVSSNQHKQSFIPTPFRRSSCVSTTSQITIISSKHRLFRYHDHVKCPCRTFSWSAS
jgi:hypothetical protein